MFTNAESRCVEWYVLFRESFCNILILLWQIHLSQLKNDQDAEGKSFCDSGIQFIQQFIIGAHVINQSDTRKSINYSIRVILPR